MQNFISNCFENTKTKIYVKRWLFISSIIYDVICASLEIKMTWFNLLKMSNRH